MYQKLLFLLIILLAGQSRAQITATVSFHQIPKYHVQTLTLASQDSYKDPFISRTVYAEFISPSGKSHTVEAFYDGENIWKIRFMPDETGQWILKWAFDSFQGNGFFSCTANTHEKIHGHLYTDPLNPRKLRFKDGTALHWMGGKYLCIRRPFGTTDLKELSFPERLDTKTYLELVKKYLDDLENLGLNGVLFKIQVLPLEYDLKSMDLLFLKELDIIVEYALYKGINIQLNLFDTWGKRKQNVNWTQRTPDHPRQLLLEPWNPKTFREETEFYLRYIVARYAAFANIHWELWNEAERLDVSAFEATRVYVPFIKSVDPYDLIISGSEMYTGHYPLDVTNPHAGAKCYPDDWGYTHRKTLEDPYGYANNKPLIWNELKPYPGDYSDQERDDWFRACFWGNLIAGCAGTGELGWTDIRTVPDQITKYHSALAHFLDHLVDVNRLEPNDEAIKAQDCTAWYCDAQSREGVAYIFTKQNQSKRTFDIELKAGEYEIKFYDPKSGNWMGEIKKQYYSSPGWKTFTTPTFDQDIVFYIKDLTWTAPVTPVEWQNVTGFQEKGRVVLKWQTATETNNYGFLISRRLESDEEFVELGFLPGKGTSTTLNTYLFYDTPPATAEYLYKISQIDLDGTVQKRFVHIYFENHVKHLDIVTWPNPARHSIVFEMQLPNAARWSLEIFNLLGQRVHKYEWVSNTPSPYQYIWNGNTGIGEKIPSGVYVYRIRSLENWHNDFVGKILWTP